MKYLLCSFTLLFVSIGLNAQLHNFKSGYITTLDDHIQSGYIDYSTDANNSKYCHFKKTMDDKTQTYLPGSIHSYRFSDSGKYYVSKKVRINDQEEELFLEYLLKGMMNVYYHSDGHRKYYFFEDENGEMNQISKEPDRNKDADHVEKIKYDGQLRYLFNGYIPQRYEDEYIDFNQKTILGIAKAYHEGVCTTEEECIEFINPNPDEGLLKCTLGIYAGLVRSTYSAEYIYLIRGAARMTGNSPMIGVLLDISYPRWSTYFSLPVDISLASVDVDKEPIGSKLQLEMKHLLFNGKVGVKYTYPKYRLRPVCEVGVSVAQLFNEEARVYLDRGEGLSEISQAYHPKKFFVGGYAGVGLDYQLKGDHALFFRASHDFFLKMGKHYVKDDLKLLQFKLGYRF